MPPNALFDALCIVHSLTDILARASTLQAKQSAAAIQRRVAVVRFRDETTVESLVRNSAPAPASTILNNPPPEPLSRNLQQDLDPLNTLPDAPSKSIKPAEESENLLTVPKLPPRKEKSRHPPSPPLPIPPARLVEPIRTPPPREPIIELMTSEVCSTGQTQKSSFNLTIAASQL